MLNLEYHIYEKEWFDNKIKEIKLDFNKIKDKMQLNINILDNIKYKLYNLFKIKYIILNNKKALKRDLLYYQVVGACHQMISDLKSNNLINQLLSSKDKLNIAFMEIECESILKEIEQLEDRLESKIKFHELEYVHYKLAWFLGGLSVVISTAGVIQNCF
jgi:hypothetical protein